MNNLYEGYLLMSPLSDIQACLQTASLFSNGQERLENVPFLTSWRSKNVNILLMIGKNTFQEYVLSHINTLLVLMKT